MNITYMYQLLVVFVSPEVALSSSFDSVVSLPFLKRNLVVVAVDEAHCIADWYMRMCLVSHL